MDFYLILALGPRNGLGYCVVNRHKFKGEIIIRTIEAEMRTAGKTLKNLRRQQSTGSNGNLWSQPYVPPRRDEDYLCIKTMGRTKAKYKRVN